VQARDELHAFKLMTLLLPRPRLLGARNGPTKLLADEALPAFC